MILVTVKDSDVHVLFPRTPADARKVLVGRFAGLKGASKKAADHTGWQDTLRESAVFKAVPAGNAEALLSRMEPISVKKGEVIIRQGDEGEPSLCVTDSGPGIDPEIGGRIFEPFFSTAGSTGLGLYLVRALCEANGGNIRLAGKNFGQGATFVITLAKDASTSGRIEDPG